MFFESCFRGIDMYHKDVNIFIAFCDFKKITLNWYPPKTDVNIDDICMCVSNKMLCVSL